MNLKSKFLMLSIIGLISGALATPAIIDVQDYKPMVMPDNFKKPGFDIELWQELIQVYEEQTGERFIYEYHKVDTFKHIFDRLETGISTAAISGITITKEREKRVDFSHSYLSTGLGILIKNDLDPSFFSSFKFFVGLASGIAPYIFIYLIYTIIAAIIIWFLELKNDMFNRDIKKGWFDGWYWVNVVITTVGFGDKVPLSNKGRTFGVLLMWSGIFFLVPLITGKVSSEMTARKLTRHIECKEDLKGKHVGVKQGTTSELEALALGAKVHTYEVIEDAAEALKKDDIEAIVHDIPALKHVEKSSKGLIVINEIFSKQDYGIVMPQGSRLREPLNRALLTVKESAFYKELYERYFGD